MASVFKPAGARKYVIVYTDETGRRRKKAGTADRGTTERIARDLENKVALRKDGLVDPLEEAYRDHEARPLPDHLADYEAHLRAKGRSESHIKDTVAECRRVFARCRAGRLSHLTAHAVQSAMAEMRDEGRSLGTCNSHATAARSFGSWLFRSHRVREDRLRGVEKFNAREDRRHDRRTLSMDELQRLIDAAHRGPKAMGMAGPARALCYRLAMATGLRFSELKSIRREAFDWTAPSVRVAAGYTKNGVEAVQGMPEALANDLRPFVEALPEGAPVFRLPRRGHGAEMLRRDLEAAGIEYRDASGLVFDFHSLRCQMATMADAAGVSPRVVQHLMRHSTLELTGRYTRPRATAIEGAVSSLPDVRPVERREPLVATGTEGPAHRGATNSATQAIVDGNKSLGVKDISRNEHMTQNPVPARGCGFKSHLRY